MVRPVPSLRRLSLVVALAALAGCGGQGSADSGPAQPVIGKKGRDAGAARDLGFPAFATKNTTRVGGGDPTADAAGAAQAVYSGRSSTTRPPAVVISEAGAWQAGVAAAVLMSPPIRAPLLLSSGTSLPSASADALKTLSPTGAKSVNKGAQLIRIGAAAKPSGYKTEDVKGSNPYALAAGIDRLQIAAAGRSADRVVVTSGEKAEYAMPAAAWAAKAGDPVLFVKRDSVPPETRKALTGHQQPKIYVLGPTSVISDKVLKDLRKLGTVTRISGRDAQANAIAFARFTDGKFGWGVVDPGHGLVFANPSRPLDAAAAAPLSATGTFGPLLLVGKDGTLPSAVVQYLLDIEPGYDRDPVRGVYNHGWLIGDQQAISLDDQSRIDSLLEIVPVRAQPAPVAPQPKPKSQPKGAKPKQQSKPAKPAPAQSTKPKKL